MKQRIQIFNVLLAVLFTAFIPLHANGPEIGSKAPEFSLVDTNGKTHALADFKGKTVVLEWTNFGCPFVVKHYGSNNMQALQKKWTKQGVIWLSICSSAKGKEGNMSVDDWNKAIANKKAASTAFLLDESGTVGKQYDAKTTPHMFVINSNGQLVYKGAIDDKPTYKQSDVKNAKNHVNAALEETSAGKSVSISATDPYGCSVKYK